MENVDFKALKEGGFMRQKDAGYFSLRLHIIGGQLDADKVSKIAELSKKYGRGYVHFTTRQGIEIPFVHLDNVDAIKKELAAYDIPTGVCGPRVRTIISCQGDVICPRGMIDAQAIAKKIDERYYGKKLPHKFKFAVTGCTASCAKPEENDFGIQGAILPDYNSENCSLCGLCKEVCYSKAIDIIDDKVVFNQRLCNACGECVKVCPMDCWQAKLKGYKIYVGGKIGKRPKLGTMLPFIVEQEKELFEVIDKTLEFYSKHGNAGERFGETLDRVGYNSLLSSFQEK